MKTIENNRGMTLIELVVAIAILGVILLAIYSFMNTGVKGFARETTTAKNQAQVRRVSNNIGREIRRASHIAHIEETPGKRKLVLTYPDGNKTEYRLDDNIIKADYYDVDDNYSYTSELARGINTFGVDVKDDTGNILAEISIESVENARGKTYKLVTEITIRK
ncbi:MAG: prepilin-type N-terminal cleavage/methylation domain-containing protein [Clostridiales bacterium]|nr:prepilin-type N-terminal cleavage/methylation domain-containing protein [Clostridiales bacterium]